jgi:hypothetical protein
MFEDCNHEDLCQLADLMLELLRSPREQWQVLIERRVGYVEEETLALFVEKLYAKEG